MSSAWCFKNTFRKNLVEVLDRNERRKLLLNNSSWFQIIECEYWLKLSHFPATLSHDLDESYFIDTNVFCFSKTSRVPLPAKRYWRHTMENNFPEKKGWAGFVTYIILSFKTFWHIWYQVAHLFKSSAGNGKLLQSFRPEAGISFILSQLETRISIFHSRERIKRKLMFRNQHFISHGEDGFVCLENPLSCTNF